MATAKASTDAFVQSPHKDFIQSPNKERDDEAGPTWTYTLTRQAVFIAQFTRAYPPWGYPSIAAARDAYDEVFLRFRRIWENGAVDGESFTKYGASTNLDSGTQPDLTGYTASTETLTTDTSSAIVIHIVFTGPSLPDIYCDDTYDQPHTFSQYLADCIAIYDDKIAAWDAASPTDEGWTYDTSGAIVDDGEDHSGYIEVAAETSAHISAGGYSDAVKIEIGATKWKFISSPSIGLKYFYTENRYINGALVSDNTFEPIDDGDVFSVLPDTTGTVQDDLTFVSLLHGKASSQPP
jgi:hypothetical protein